VVDRELDHLRSQLEAAFDEVVAGLQQVREQVEALAVAATVDSTGIEDAVTRGSLHNAADIANLRQDVEDLVEAVRVQDKGIGELRTTLDWIKERLLLR
jgi:hypothetical protein